MVNLHNKRKPFQHLSLIFIIITSFLLSAYSNDLVNTSSEIGNSPGEKIVQATSTPGSSANTDQDDICAFSDEDCTDPEGMHGNFVVFSEEMLSKAEVIAVLFWMEDCASCAEVINSVIPDITIKYANQVVFYPIELKEIDSVDKFYQMAERYGVPKNNIGVPLVIIADQILTGNQIQTDIEKWISRSLEKDPYALLAIPEFADQLPQIIQEKQMDIQTNEITNKQSSPFVNPRSLVILLGIGIPIFAILAVGMLIIKKRSKSVR